MLSTLSKLDHDMSFFFFFDCFEWDRLLHGHRLGQVTREINIETRADGKPIGNELQRNNIEKTLEAIGSLGDFDFLSLSRREFGIIVVADDNRTTSSGNDY